jgi:hypothetical protein
MLQVKTSESFDQIINKVARRASYVIETRGARKTIIAGGKKLAAFRPGIPNPDIKSIRAHHLMRVVRASVTRYIVKKKLEVPEIKKKYPVVFTNRFFWLSVPNNTEFYIIDAKHAYWRIAYLQGYIGEKLYGKYAEDKDLKAAKNISLAILNSNHIREYFVRGKKVAEIECDISLYSRIYDNIRHFSFNFCGMIRNDLDAHCFAYRTDGVFLLKPGIARAKKIFEENNLFYKIEKCIKIDDKTYSTGDGELKRFM